MQAVLATAVPVNELGLLVLKLGQQLQLVGKGRVVVAPAPATLDAHQPGLVELSAFAESPLQEDLRLDAIWQALTKGSDWNMNGLRNFVTHGCGCQIGGDHCHKEITTRQVGSSWVRLCWIHDQDIGNGEELAALVRRNQAAYWLSRVNAELGHPAAHALTMPELCWWLTMSGCINLLPDTVAREVLGRPASGLVRKPMGFSDTDDRYLPHPGDQLQRMAKPVRELEVDAEPPARLMLRPKPMVWTCANYTRYVKALPCVVCGAQADDPHHLIGHGQGKMGGKAHDLFVIPMCRQHHDELHRNVGSWELKHGSQFKYLVATLDRALKEGALV